MRNKPEPEEQQELPEGIAVTVTVSVAGAAQEQKFNHVSVTNLGGPGVTLHNSEGRVIAFFPYDTIISVVATEADKPKSKIVVPTPVVTLQ